MRIELDRDTCTGHGRCYSLAPDFYEPDENGYCTDPTGHVPEALEQSARLGAENCPEEAITVVDD